MLLKTCLFASVWCFPCTYAEAECILNHLNVNHKYTCPRWRCQHLLCVWLAASAGKHQRAVGPSESSHRPDVAYESVYSDRRVHRSDHRSVLQHRSELSSLEQISRPTTMEGFGVWTECWLGRCWVTESKVQLVCVKKKKSGSFDSESMMSNVKWIKLIPVLLCFN